MLKFAINQSISRLLKKITGNSMVNVRLHLQLNTTMLPLQAFHLPAFWLWLSRLPVSVRKLGSSGLCLARRHCFRDGALKPTTIQFITVQYPLPPELRVRGVCWSLDQLSQGENRLNPWTSRPLQISCVSITVWQSKIAIDRIWRFILCELITWPRTWRLAYIHCQDLSEKSAN